MDEKANGSSDFVFDTTTLDFAPPIKRRNRANLRFPVSFDPECPNLHGSLNETELACIYVCLDYFHENGKFPPSEIFLTVMRAGFKKYGLDSAIFSDELGYGELFSELFPFDPNKKVPDAIRRLTGFPNSQTSPEECKHAIRFASELLSLKRNSPNPQLPTTGDIKRAIVAQIIVPELNAPMPSPETIIRQLGYKTWKEAVTNVLNVSQEQAREQLNTKVTLEDLMDDYRNAFKFFHGDKTDNDDRIVTYDQLEQFRETQGGLGYRRYTNFIRKAVDAGIYINVNDLRRHAGMPVNEVTDNRRIRRTVELWTPEQIVEGYMAAWEHLGSHNDPPTHDQLIELSLLQTDAINSKGFLDPTVAIARNIPEVRVPTQKAIEQHFISLTRFLGYLEHECKFDMKIVSDHRIGKMAGVSLEKGRDPSELPTCVAQRMAEMQSCPITTIAVSAR